MAKTTFESEHSDVNVTSIVFRYRDDTVIVNSLQSNQICIATASWATALSTARHIVGGEVVPSLLGAFRSLFGMVLMTCTVSLITLNIANAAPLDDEKKKRLAIVMNRVLESLSANLGTLSRDVVVEVDLPIEDCEGMRWGARVSKYIDNQLRVDLFVDAQGGSDGKSPIAPEAIARASDAFRPAANASALVETDPEEWAELTTEQLDTLIKRLDEAKTIRAKKNMLGKRDGRSSHEAFINLVNRKLDLYAGTRPSTEEKKELVRLIHEAQELGAELLYDGEPCRITVSKRGDATTFSFRVRSRETGKAVKSGSKVPENLKIVCEEHLPRLPGVGKMGPSAHPA